MTKILLRKSLLFCTVANSVAAISALISQFGYVPNSIAVICNGLLICTAILLSGLVALWLCLKNDYPYGVVPQLKALNQKQPDFHLLREIFNDQQWSIGWNLLVQEVQQRDTLTQLEASVSRKLGEENAQAETSILNGLGEGLCVTDTEGRLTFINNALCALLDQQADQLLHHPVEQMLPANVSEETMDAIAHQHPVFFDIEQERNGIPVVQRWSRRPQLNESGKLAGQIWSIRDVTQQKMAEEAREQFVSMATHELRTPLANINAYAETLQMTDEIDIEQQKEFFNIIQSEATRLARFVDELLEVSRMEAGSLTIQQHEVDIERLILDVCKKVEPTILQKQQTFEKKIPAKLPHLLGDKDSLAAALVNLLGNASKYTPEGGEIKFIVEQDNDTLAFRIQDSGIGIAPEEIPRVFEKFFRSEDHRVRDVTGSGLGLSLTQQVVHLHQGEMDVHSELNKGSIFSMILPIQERSQA